MTALSDPFDQWGADFAEWAAALPDEAHQPLIDYQTGAYKWVNQALRDDMFLARLGPEQRRELLDSPRGSTEPSPSAAHSARRLSIGESPMQNWP